MRRNILTLKPGTMNSRSIFTLVLGMLMFSFTSNGQIFKSKTPAEPEEEETEEVVEVPEKAEIVEVKDTAKKVRPTKEQIQADHFLGYDNRGALAINISSIGIGLEYAHNINRHLNGRLRLNTLNISDYGQAIELSGSPTYVTANVNVLNTDILLEYLPFKQSSFKMVFGGSIIFNGKADINVAYNEEIQYGDLIIDPEEVGDLTIGVDYGGFAPYIGIGFGRAVPRKSVGFGLELGTYYAGSPNVSLQATNMLADTVQEEEQLQSNLSDYKWMPFLNMRLAFRL